MSSSRYSKTIHTNTAPRSNANVKMYCAVCHAAGKSEAVYTSHFIRETRDPNSRVTCVTLLSQECRFCFKKGHTVKYCPALAEKNKKPAEPLARKEQPKKAQKTSGNEMLIPKNRFACLNEPENDAIEDKDEFPELPPRLCRRETNDTYATNAIPISANPMPMMPPRMVRIETTDINANLPEIAYPKGDFRGRDYSAALAKPVVVAKQEQVIAPPMPIPRGTGFRGKMCSWADDSSSDEEDNE